MPRIDGGTGDLAQVARAARAWHDGAALDDIRQVAPCVRLTGRFEVPDNDPELLTESDGQGKRQEAADLEYVWQETYQRLIEAAYAEPVLRVIGGQDLGEFATAQEAVAAAVRHQPSGLGPTTLGG
ncbi:hypothetical protein [Streptomyces olivochromogenes]|uniref:hypothetical protein n=1 Tax=Streptomyces olivochromogenes TaxID=1963 RepID=UPI001F309533|nr:hypothetical protein [Streptomyces olivochromogenes]MCF3134701.1 hypothetical protein [Streptomyces olivochromogenes]